MKMSTSAPEEDPETKARRQAEERRAEAAALSSDQALLERLTLRRLRRFGNVGTGPAGGASLVYPGAPGGGSGSGGGGNISVGGGTRGGGGGFFGGGVGGGSLYLA